jgi:hypothetical protein
MADYLKFGGAQRAREKALFILNYLGYMKVNVL